LSKAVAEQAQSVQQKAIFPFTESTSSYQTRSTPIDLTYNAPKPGEKMNPKEFKNAAEGNSGE